MIPANPAPVLLLLAVLATAWIAYRGRRLPPFPGRDKLVMMHMAAAWWAFAAGMETLSSAPAEKILWAELAWPGIVLAPAGWAFFVWSYVNGRAPRRERLFIGVAALVAAVTTVVALTNDQHHLLYASTRLAGPEPGAAVLYEHGPWFFIVTGILYLVMLATVVITVSELQRAPTLYRMHYLGLLGAVGLPWIANILYVAGAWRLFDFDPTPFAFLVSGLIFQALLARREFVSLPPIARNALLDALPDPVFVIDAHGLVVEVNDAAHVLPDMPEDPVGTRVAELGTLVELAGPLLDSSLSPVAASREAECRSIGRQFEIRRIPLAHRGRVVGTMLILRDVTDRKHMEGQLRLAVETLERRLTANVDLQNRLREETIRDPLTGVYNRRFFDEVRSDLLADARLRSWPIAAVILDLDHFKRLNDEHGHQAGDATLRATGALLLKSIRKSDFVFRIGGEEFLAILPGMDAGGAVERVERWAAAFRRMTAEARHGVVPSTFSAGVAAFPDHASDWEQLIRCADRALYSAKSAGRNRVVSFADLDDGDDAAEKRAVA